jgi:hypothetical protein
VSTPPDQGIVLFHTLGCHLCELAEELVVPVARAHGLRLRLIDISESDDLLERYGVRIPVLFDPVSGAELGWPFDADAAALFVSAAR